MKANIRISLWIPLVFVIVMAVFLYIDIGILSILIGLGVLLIVLYYILGFIKRNDALTIEDGTMRVITPIKSNVYDLANVTSVSIEDGGSILYGSYQKERIKLIPNIYDVPLEDIKDYLLTQYPHISDQTK